jgi:tetrahydromethanopterin S-methyltransferase subunit G
MGTLNGKLIHRELNEFDTLAQKAESINQRCDYLEAEYLQKISQEVNSHKSDLQRLEQRIGFLEDVTSKQAKQLSFLKISGVISLIGLWFILSANSQPKDEKTKPLKKTESLEFIQPKSINRLFGEI